MADTLTEDDFAQLKHLATSDNATFEKARSRMTHEEKLAYQGYLDRTREDQNMVTGVSPDMLLGGMQLGRGVLSAIKQAPTMAGKAWNAASSLMPVARYEALRHGLQTIGVPYPIAAPLAGAAEGAIGGGLRRIGLSAGRTVAPMIDNPAVSTETAADVSLPSSAPMENPGRALVEMSRRTLPPPKAPSPLMQRTGTMGAVSPPNGAVANPSDLAQALLPPPRSETIFPMRMGTMGTLPPPTGDVANTSALAKALLPIRRSSTAPVATATSSAIGLPVEPSPTAGQPPMSWQDWALPKSRTPVSNPWYLPPADAQTAETGALAHPPVTMEQPPPRQGPPPPRGPEPGISGQTRAKALHDHQPDPTPTAPVSSMDEQVALDELRRRVGAEEAARQTGRTTTDVREVALNPSGPQKNASNLMPSDPMARIREKMLNLPKETEDPLARTNYVNAARDPKTLAKMQEMQRGFAWMRDRPDLWGKMAVPLMTAPALRALMLQRLAPVASHDATQGQP